MARKDIDGFNKGVSESLGAFVNSSAWRVVKYRLLIEYADRLQKESNDCLRAGKYDKAAGLLNKIDGVSEAVQITERLESELNKGLLDVDEALRVIEKNGKGGR